MVPLFYRITDQRYEKLPYFVFGDFNFRLDSKQVIEVRIVCVSVCVCVQALVGHVCLCWHAVRVHEWALVCVCV